ncbi:MAG: 16S rRNA (guanine(527)-N(7))-methyltransferase RsmG [Clostridiales Family XIII bacterium]|jgi:16S rRNA (guanine527-N7)-methyltransferase|nr:16S rRNA (guanine(527)-N(7))-methyltransferase RsmG [Clostridiales Family XIII bacterium]
MSILGNGDGVARLRLEQGLSLLSRRARAGAGACAMPLGAAAGLESLSERLLFLMELVLEKNEQINLTTITEPVEFVELHLLDSLACVGLSGIETARRIADVGSGAGFPGLPLALVYPEKEFVLTDSLRKRTEFAAAAARALGLDNVTVRHARAETVGRDPLARERFDLALCRAVGKLPLILEYCLPLVRAGGQFFAYKTVRAEGEIEDSLVAREVLGGGADMEIFTYKDLLPRRGHAIYIFSKERTTPSAYPRKEGVPARIPL